MSKESDRPTNKPYNSSNFPEAVPPKHLRQKGEEYNGQKLPYSTGKPTPRDGQTY